jgi:hypothetical protein
MKKGFAGLAALGLMLAAFLLAGASAGAQSVDDKIKALEQELSSLKSQQMELKKEATAAAAALPSFSYRPGNGAEITAADKSWGLRFSMETHLRMLFESGQDQVGRTNGEIMLRRWRPFFWYCIDNCLYEIETALDMDGFGTGNAKNSTNTGGSSIMQRGVVHFHLENLNPWMPTVDIGGDVSTAFSTIRQGSSAVGTQMDYDLLSRNYGPNTGRSGFGIVMNWDDRDIGPGRITRFQLAYASVNEGDDNLSSFKDRKSWNTFIGYQPFSQLKEKWIRGLQFELAGWFCNVDDRPQADNGCGRLRIQDNGDAGRQTLFDTGANSRGKGVSIFGAAGVQWEVGPYRLRMYGAKIFPWGDGNNSGVTTSNAFSGRKEGKVWLIGHDLFLWSPKGFLTGSANAPGSILVGTHFERNDVECPVPRCQTGAGAPGTLSQFHRGTYIVREWDVFYFLAPRMSVGAHFLWYDASNLTTTVQRNLGVHKNGRVGGGGDWVDWNLNFRYQF